MLKNGSDYSEYTKQQMITGKHSETANSCQDRLYHNLLVVTFYCRQKRPLNTISDVWIQFLAAR